MSTNQTLGSYHESQVIRSKNGQNLLLNLNQNLSSGQIFLATQFFSVHWHFIETTKTGCFYHNDIYW